MIRVIITVRGQTLVILNVQKEKNDSKRLIIVAYEYHRAIIGRRHNYWLINGRASHRVLTVEFQQTVCEDIRFLSRRTHSKENVIGTPTETA